MIDDTIAERPRAAVVGSGIAGLAAAFHLTEAGVDVELLEREDQIGGRFGVARLGERPVMLGGKNVGRRYHAFRAFAAALGVDAYEEFGINSSRVEAGEVVTFDSGRAGRSVRNALRGASRRDVARLVGLATRLRRNEDNRFLGSPLAGRLSERGDDMPLSAHFGPAMTRRLLRPMTVRMNGAEPDEVYLGTFCTNLALVLDTFDQLVGGIQPLLDAMARRVTVRTGCVVDELLVEGGRVTGLRLTDQDGELQERRYDGVVVATPARPAASILRSTVPRLSSRLDSVRYFPTTVALVEYDRPVFTSTVRALAMDDGPCSNAGAYGREDRHVVRFTFSGRHARIPSPSEALIEEWLGEAQERLHRHVPTSCTATRVRQLTRHWSAGYCGYVPYHARFLAAVRGDVAAVPGLELAGDYLLGVSLEACCRSGAAAGRELAAQTALVTA